MYCLSFNLLEKRVLAPYCGCGILYPSALVGSCSNSCRSKGHPGKILFARDTVSFGQPTRGGIHFESLLACRQQVLLRGCAYLSTHPCADVSMCLSVTSVIVVQNITYNPLVFEYLINVVLSCIVQLFYAGLAQSSSYS